MFEKSSRPPSPPGEPVPSASPPTAEATRSRSALVVDDEPDMVFVICHQLERLGFCSTAAESVREARTLLAVDTFDLIVVDLLLPGPSGADLVRALAGDPRHRGAAVVVASVLDDATHPVSADARITKPFRPGQLAAAIESAARRARLRGDAA